MSVYAYQKLLESDARAAMWEKQGTLLGRDGVVTEGLIKFAMTDVSLGRFNSPNANQQAMKNTVMLIGIGDGVVSQLASDGMDMLNAAAAFNPLTSTFWRETVPNFTALVTGIGNGKITASSLFEGLKESVKQEFVEPFQYIKNNYNRVVNLQASYEENREFGKNVAKAIMVVGAAISLGAGVAKLASKLPPKLVEGIEGAVGKSVADAEKLESKVVEGTGKKLPHPIGPRGPAIIWTPSFKQEEIALKTYEKLRGTGLDPKELETFSKNTGLTLEESRLLKDHIFMTEHVNLADWKNGEYYYKGYFDPDIDIAYGWEKALEGELNIEQKSGLKH